MNKQIEKLLKTKENIKNPYFKKVIDDKIEKLKGDKIEKDED